MSNPAFTSVVFVGDRREARSLCEPDIEYFDTIGEACAPLSAYIGRDIAANWNALEEAAVDWNDSHEDADWPVAVKQIEVIGNDELWD